jgi:hypothetical protein
MERVETLSKMLAEKIEKKANYDDILVTVKMIESELLHLKTIQPIVKNAEKPTTTIDIFKNRSDDLLDNDAQQEKIVEVLQINEKEVEAELEEIRHNLNHLAFMAAKNKPAFKIDEEETEKLTIEDLHKSEIKVEEKEVETVAPIIEIEIAINPIKEINESIQTEKVISINERLNVQQHEITDKLKDAPIEDLKKAIGVNERFLYLNELFRNDDIMYDKSIKTINAFTTYEEAELWIRKELKLRLGWDDNYNTVKQFYSLVRRRFS